MKLTPDQSQLLVWLSEEDATPFGSCKGITLDTLIGAGFARVNGESVALTESGWRKVREIRP